VTGRAVLIGVGNSYRRDDGIGLTVVGAVSELNPAEVSTVASGGEPAELIEAWTGADLVVLVDAVPRVEATPGQIHRRVLVPEDPAQPVPWPSPVAASSHRMGVADALCLAAALDRLPRQLVAFGVEPADTGYGPGLSPAVAAALPGIVQAVLAELGVS
jgi:hydrogenase maturation protease